MDKLILKRTSSGKISKFKNITKYSTNLNNLINNNKKKLNFNYRLNFIFIIILILNFTIDETSAAAPAMTIADPIVENKNTDGLIHTNDNSNLILETAKLRHNGNNEYNIGKHEGVHRKFRSTTNNQQQQRSSRDLNNALYKLGEKPLRIDGFRIEHNPKKSEEPDALGIPEILSDTEVVIRIFGSGFTEDTLIAFSHEENNYGGSCLVTSTGLFSIDSNSITDKTALFKISLPKSDGKIFYFCAKNDNNIKDRYLDASLIKPLIHQGSDIWLRLKSFEPLLPLWVSIAIILTCLIFSALFSGLNLGLMALDRTELKILRNTGSLTERNYAKKIQPVRDHGNFLLCSILLGNVLVNSTFTILLDSLTSGVVAVISSTIAIVIFGEITPQAICSRHGLAVGAKTIIITKAIMLITFPLAYPTSKILDYLLGEEIGNVYNRERLKELVKVTNDVNDLDKNEVNIISGALELRRKTVGDVMTHIDDAFMLSLNAILDFETVSEIMKSGYSRIPVYDGDRKNIVTLLYIKDLAFVDPDDNTPLKTLCEFYQNPCHFVFEDVTLDIMFNQFKEGNKGHMAFVHRVNNEGEGDPFYETIGLVTLEDVIEELIQAEIIDETDVFTDNRNRTKIRRTKIQKQDFTIFAERRENQKIRISPQLTLATFQYLSTSVEAFKKDSISETILRRLLNQDIINNIRYKGKERDDPSLLIYEQGKAVDFFVLILEGRVEVTVGRESLVFESGPFTYFGTQALVQNFSIESIPQSNKGSLQSLNIDVLVKHTFTPDYSVRATTDVIYIAIKRSLYLAAKRATLLEISQKLGGDPSSDPIDDEVEKLLHSLDEDDRSIRNNTNAGGRHTPKNHHHHTTQAIINNDSDNKFLRDGNSNSPSPTASVSIINLIRRKNQDDHRNDHIMYATNKDTIIHPNGPQQQQSASSPNSLQTSFNQHSASLLGSQQTSNNSMAVIPNLSSMDDSCGDEQQISPSKSAGGGRGSGCFVSIDFADASDASTGAAGGDGNIENNSNIGVTYSVIGAVEQKLDDNNMTTADTPLLANEPSNKNPKC